MGDFILSAFADEYCDSFEEQLKALNKFGIGYIEIRHVDGKNISVLTETEVKEAKAKLDFFGIKASSIGSPIGKISLGGDIGAHLESAGKVFEAANILGAKYVRIFSFYAPEGKGKSITEMKTVVFENLGKLIALARKYGVTLCHENEAMIYGDIPSRCREIMDFFGGEIKCVFDMGNFVLENTETYAEAYEILKDYIAYFHIKDALYKGAIVPPGKGEAKIKEIIEAHKKCSKQDFFVSLEPHLQTFSGLNALAGRSFENPYKYKDAKSAFSDAVTKFRELF